MKKLLVILAMFSFLVSCSQNDVENLSIKGMIKDNSTGEPVTIQKSEFKIECWKKANSRDESYGDFERLNLSTNSQGEFSIKFDKGSYIVFKVEKEGYDKFIGELDVKKNENFYEIHLIPED